MKIVHTFSAFALFLGLSSAAFSQTTQYSVAGQSMDWLGYRVEATRDMNGDHVPDFIALGSPFNAVARAFSGIDGAPILSIDEPPSSAFFSAIGVPDWNGDGSRDYVFGERSRITIRSGADGAVLEQWLLGNFGGYSETALRTEVLAIPDRTGDSLPEILCSYVLEVMDNTGHWTYFGVVEIHNSQDGEVLLQWVEPFVVDSPLPIVAFGDVDGDGMNDFAYGSPSSDNSNGLVRIVSGQEGQILSTIVPSESDSSFGVKLTNMGDYDGDGSADLAIGSLSPSDYPFQVTVVSTRTASVIKKINPNIHSVSEMRTVGDVDGDNVLDLAIGDYGSLRIFSGSTGLLALTIPGVTDGAGGAIALLGDVNADGRPEIAVSTPAASVGGVLLTGRVDVITLP